MAQIITCDHCGNPIDESTQSFARVNFNASAGGGGQFDYHNDAANPCFYTAYEALKGVSAHPDYYDNSAAVAPQSEAPDAAPATTTTQAQ